MKIVREVVFGLSVVLLTACGSSSSATTSPAASPAAAESRIAGFDPCVLLTAEEASAASGKTMANIVAMGGPKIPGACIYRSGTASVVFVYAQVYPNAATAAAVTAGQFESALVAEFGSGKTSSNDVGGIGDRATEITAQGDAGSGIAILVYKSNVVFLIGVKPTSDSSLVQNLARTAVGRLH